jgi:cytidylate kinase
MTQRIVADRRVRRRFAASIHARDRSDTTRTVSPLTLAADAVRIRHDRECLSTRSSDEVMGLFV